MLMLGIRSGSILKRILSATADNYCTLVEVGVGLARVFQHLFDLVPVVAGVPVHLFALTPCFLAPVICKAVLALPLACFFRWSDLMGYPPQCRFRLDCHQSCSGNGVMKGSVLATISPSSFMTCAGFVSSAASSSVVVQALISASRVPLVVRTAAR